MSWRDCVSPSQEREIDALSSQFSADKEREMEEWAKLVRAGKTDLSLRDWLQKRGN